jgi:hypothetical protein
MTPIEDIITRNTDAILNALQARFEARPMDAELQAVFIDAAKSVNMMVPANAEHATPEERAEYLVGLKARLADLPLVFRHASDPARALRNLVICWHCVDRLLELQYVDAETADAMKGDVLGHYAVYAPVVP